MRFFKLFCLFIIIFSLSFAFTRVLAQDVVTLPNPLGPQQIKEKDILNLAGKIANGFIGVSGSLALLMFVYGGFLWLTSRGEPDKIKKGKGIFVWSVVGLAVIFSSYFLVQFVLKGVAGAPTGGRCCVQKLNNQYACSAIPSGDDTLANSCANTGGDVVVSDCKEIAACPVE